METDYRQLVLCPSDQAYVPASRAQLLTVLREFGVIGAPVDKAAEDRFLIGDAFLQLFSFMGCAPSIEFEPTSTTAIDWQAFVFVHLSPALDQVHWLADRDLAKPGCPACQRRMRNWAGNLMTQDRLQCMHCQHLDHVCHWRWYDGGGCARQFISIVNVFPKESLPTDTLMSHLQQETGTAWQYFYLHAPLITK